MMDYTFFYTECPICHIFKFRTFDSKKRHAHFVVCRAIERMYEKVVLAPNKGHVRDSWRTIVDVEINRIYDEMHGGASWINPLYIKEEDKMFLANDETRKTP